MKGWQATLTLIGGLAAGISLWFGFVMLDTAPDGNATRIVRVPAPAAVTTAGTTPSGIVGATAPVAGAANPAHAFTIAVSADELGALLMPAPVVSHGRAGPALYVISFRACPTCSAFYDRESAALEAAGIELRNFVYARRDKDSEVRSSPEERAVVSELALARDAALFDAWMKGRDEDFYRATKLPPWAESSPQRAAAIEAGRTLVDHLTTILAANGQDLAIPALFWREGGAWRGYIGYDPTTFGEVRSGLGLTLGPPATPAPAPSAPAH
jgi:hypothetical protein